MSFFIKKFFTILSLLTIWLLVSQVDVKEDKTQYKKKNISNYFSGIISINQNHSNKAFRYLKKVQLLKDRHSRFNIEFIRTLVLLKKFDQGFSFSKNVWVKDDLIFEIDLLLGLNYFLNKDYSNAEKHFERLNKLSQHNLFFDDFIGNTLISWSKAAQGNKEESFRFLEKIPITYRNITKTQNTLLQCYFNDSATVKSFQELINDKNYNFSRYNFFLANHFLFNNQIEEAKNLIKNSNKKYYSNLLIKQTNFFFLNDENEKVKSFFNCKNPSDSIAEFFYVISNLFATEENYKLSNFYLQISLFLNNKFLPNTALLAENYYFQDKNLLSKSIYESIKAIGEIYSWHASKRIATILLDIEGKEYATSNLEKEFNLLSKLNFEHYYEMANYYKDNKYYEKSIEYYSLALSKIKIDHPLTPKILDRRGTSLERIDDWKNAEKDLAKSLKLLPDQAHVINYLAYSWIDKGINLDKGLEMLKKANKLKENDGYIIDSLGWAYYAKKNYEEAEFFLQQAVELLPLDPIINYHYADALWMLNKNIQARYFWKYVLNLDTTEKKLKDDIRKRLIFGVTKKL